MNALTGPCSTNPPPPTRRAARLCVIGCLAFVTAGCAEGGRRTIDLADPIHNGKWVRHPICGDVSYDSFVHAANNPVHRGSSPYTWPVNGSLFRDPVGGKWYLYVGHYTTGYADLKVPMHCTVFCSADQGRSWQELGPIFTGPPFVYEGEVSPVFHAPDVSVFYADGRYHMCFDWATQNTTWENVVSPPPDANSGVGYAWSERPEGPFHITSKPVASTRNQQTLLGKYRRLYISSMIKRKHDWLVLTDSDSGHNFGWALLGMTAAQPEGPYGEAKLLLHPESERFMPVPVEFNPVFTHDGFIYVPATSIGLNRNYQVMFRVPIERAMDPDAWQVVQNGSMWHAEPVEHEHFGIWGQTFSGFIGPDGVFNVMFPSRDPAGLGTINIASRPWNKPLRDRGFVISGHEGPSIAYLKHAGQPERMEVRLRQAKGTISLLWNASGVLGIDSVQFPSAMHPRVLRDYSALELAPGKWSLVHVNADGQRAVAASGSLNENVNRHVLMTWTSETQMALSLDGRPAWEGRMDRGDRCLGVLASPNSHAEFGQFTLTGKPHPATITCLYTDALLGAAEKRDDWPAQTGERFRLGMGAISSRAGQMAKWNFEGSAFKLWAPKSPAFGKAELVLDGRSLGQVDFAAEAETASQCVYEMHGLNARRGHALVLRAADKPVPLDVLEVQP